MRAWFFSAIAASFNKSLKSESFQDFRPLRLAKKQMICIIYFLTQGGVPLNSALGIKEEHHESPFGRRS